MGRKKKEKNGEDKPEEERMPALGSDAKRSIVAIFLFAFSILFLLAFIGQAGKFGETVAGGLGLLVGWSRWLLIPLFVLVGVMLLRRHETTTSDVIKYTGLTLAFLSVLGLTHLFLGDNAEELMMVADEGRGGGYLGYFIVALLSEALGKVATLVLLLALFVSGVIAAFNMSLLAWFERMRDGWNKKPGEGDGVGEVVTDPAMSLSDVIPPVSEETIPIDSVLPKTEEHNVSNIRFVGDDLKEETVEEGLDESGLKKMDLPGEWEKAPVPPKRKNRIRWELPPTTLLEATTGEGGGGDIDQRKQIIVNTLKYFGIEVEPGEVQVGPTVTQYTFRPAVGVKLSRITTLNNDLALALAAHPIRIEAPIPGKSLIGIEVPNKTTATVRLKEVLQSREFRERSSNLTLVLGQDVSGKHILADLAKMPHLLVAGATNSGKSICINSLILSLLYQNSPDDLKFILVDPKRVELSLYNGIPHLRTDVIVDNHKVVGALRWAVGEMEERYKILESVGSRDIASYREKVNRGEKRRFVDTETNEVKEEELGVLPQIVIIIDEMADLMLVHGKEVESVIIRLAQMSRAVGIHLILATQKPLSEVITSLIKSNIPARIAFYVSNQIDSRTILDAGGAEKLLGKGDMLYSPAGGSQLLRVQGSFISENEVKRVVKFLVDQKIEKGYEEIGEDLGGGPGTDDHSLGGGNEGEGDPIYEAAKKLVIDTQRVSTTYLQTYLKIGYPKAARTTELLEKNGVIGPTEGGKRTVLIKPSEAEEKQSYGEDPLADQAQRDKWQM